MTERARRVVVVGAGIAGTAAALAAARTSAAVTLLDGGAGASTLATGALDLTPWQPSAETTHAGEPELPVSARDVLEALGVHVLTARPALLLTTAGVRRPARGRDAALLDVARLAGRPLGVVRCARPGWDADVLARVWGEALHPDRCAPCSATPTSARSRTPTSPRATTTTTASDGWASDSARRLR